MNDPGAIGVNAISSDASRTDADQRRLPGEPGMWMFVAGDMLVFSFFFLVYAYYAAQSPVLYAAGRQSLDQTLGLLNTFVLLTSSWLLFNALQRVRADDSRRATLYLLGTMILGLCFCAVKAREYYEKVASGIALTSNEFYTFYFMYTGIHLLHVVIGLSISFWVLAEILTGMRRNRIEYYLETFGTFWHFVDIIWVILFAMFYLI